MKKIMIMLSMICLNTGCDKVTLPTIENQERCVLSLEYNKCRCHEYAVTRQVIGRVSPSEDKPIEYCENLVGFKASSWVKYVLWFEEIFETVDDANKNNLEKPYIESENEIKGLINEISK